MFQYIHLLKLDGTNLRNFFICALKKTITDKLVCEFNWNEFMSIAGALKLERFINTRVAVDTVIYNKTFLSIVNLIF